MTEANMIQIIKWLNEHNIYAVKTIGSVALLLLASIVIPRLSRSLKQWLIHLESRLNVTGKTNSIINRVIVAALWTLTVFIVLDIWGIGLGGVWAVLVGVVTIIGVGFIATWAMTRSGSKSHVHDAQRRQRQCAANS